jgi:GWxTD domain-containing protein
MGHQFRMRSSRVGVHASRGFISLLILTLSLAVLAPPSAAQKQKLEKNYREWLDRDVAYIITKEERNTFLKLTTDEARDQFIQNFWEVRNPTPGSPENTYKDEIYKRIAYADAYFGAGSGGEGWRTDRGRAYITLGPPQQKEVHYGASNMFPLEIWFYSFSHPSLPPFFYIMFYKHEGFGDFRFYSPFVDGPDKLMSGTEYINDRLGAIQGIQESVGPLVARLSQSLPPPTGPAWNRTPCWRQSRALRTIRLQRMNSTATAP